MIRNSANDETIMTIEIINNRNDMNILINMNTFNSNIFEVLFYSNFGADF